MSNLSNIRAAIADKIKTEFGTDFDVDVHSGRFDAAELAKFVALAPAIRVAILGFNNIKNGNTESIGLRLQIGIYVVTKDTITRLDRDTSSLSISERLLLFCHGNFWGLKNVEAAEIQGAQNLYNDTLLKAGASIWAIDVAQNAIIQTSPIEAETPIKEIFVGISPEIGVPNVDKYFPINVEGTDSE